MMTVRTRNNLNDVNGSRSFNTRVASGRESESDPQTNTPQTGPTTIHCAASLARSVKNSWIQTNTKMKHGRSKEQQSRYIYRNIESETYRAKISASESAMKQAADEEQLHADQDNPGYP